MHFYTILRSFSLSCAFCLPVDVILSVLALALDQMNSVCVFKVLKIMVFVQNYSDLLVFNQI